MWLKFYMQNTIQQVCPRGASSEVHLDLSNCSIWVHRRGIDYDYALHLYTMEDVVTVVRPLPHQCLRHSKPLSATTIMFGHNFTLG